MATRVRDYEKDSERIAKELLRRAGKSIQDRGTFDDAFLQYMGAAGEPLIEKSKFSDKVFRDYRDIAERDGKTISKKNIFKDAGGKNLKRDRETTANVVVDSSIEYTKKGAGKVDLRGYDTRKERFIFTGRQKGSIVDARKITIRFRGKSQTRYIDRRGRYVSIKKKK